MRLRYLKEVYTEKVDDKTRSKADKYTARILALFKLISELSDQ